MARAYKVIDADGHILEPLDLWDRYMDPAYRQRALSEDPHRFPGVRRRLDRAVARSDGPPLR